MKMKGHFLTLKILKGLKESGVFFILDFLHFVCVCSSVMKQVVIVFHLLMNKPFLLN